MVINVPEVKQKILRFLEEKGPSLPVHITKATGLNMMFSSAILSELLNEKKIKTSYMRVGSSPLYLIPGQETKLESFAENNLLGIEKEAFLKLKQHKFLGEEEQEPALRHALKGIKDFATAVKIEDKIFWKYYLITNEELSSLTSKKSEMRQVTEQVWQDIDREKYKEKISEIAKGIEGKQKELEDEKEEVLKKVLKPTESNYQIPEKPRIIEKKKIQKNFFLEIKEKIDEKKIPLIEAVYVGKKDLMIRSVIDGQEVLLLAFDKKRVADSDLIKLLRKTTINLPLCIISRGEIPKKMRDLINIYKKISNTFIL